MIVELVLTMFRSLTSSCSTHFLRFLQQCYSVIKIVSKKFLLLDFERFLKKQGLAQLFQYFPAICSRGPVILVLTSFVFTYPFSKPTFYPK